MSRPDRALARGRAFLGPLRHVKSVHGRAAVDALAAQAPPPLVAVLERKISQGAWYPYEAYVALLHAIDRQHGSGDLAYCRELGRWAGAEDLGSMFRIYAMLASPERLIRSCRLIWPQYYDHAGEMEALGTSADDTRLRISGFARMDPAHCRLMEGWMISTMKQIGCQVNDDARETTCTSRGGAYHEFTCTWKKI